MTTTERTTFFAPSERAPAGVIRQQTRRFLDNAVLSQLYDAVSELVLILNAQRQIVFCNRKFLEFLDARDADAVHGQRPGEALGCVHAAQLPGGCGTTEFCITCGAVNAFLKSAAGEPNTQECSILRGKDALDLLVRSSPLDVEDERYTIVALVDISHEKRRRALERIFFHDLMNSAIGLQIMSRALKGKDGSQESVSAKIIDSTNMLVDEIEGQRDLLAAEMHELRVHAGSVISTELLEELRAGYAQFAQERGCAIAVNPKSARICFTSDRKILMRVLRNMLKNAIEASRRGDVVTMSCHGEGNMVQFRVHNRAFIPRPLQLQIFQRSFSTRGIDRGLGTYSVKLLTERYLKGTVSFTSSESEGTTFRVSYPLSL